MGRFSGGGKKEIMELKVFLNFQQSSSRRQDEEITSSSARRGFEWILEKISSWKGWPGIGTGCLDGAKSLELLKKCVDWALQDVV